MCAFLRRSDKGRLAAQGADEVLPAEILQRVRRVEIRTKALVNEFFAGEYQSAFKGQGMEFASIIPQRGGIIGVMVICYSDNR